MSADTREEFVRVRRDILEGIEESLQDALDWVREEIEKEESQSPNRDGPGHDLKLFQMKGG